MHDKGAGRLSTPSLTTILSVHMTWFFETRVTIDEVAHVLQFSHGSVYVMMHNKLRFRKICERWVPKQLSEVHKQMCVDICQKHVIRLHTALADEYSFVELADIHLVYGTFGEHCIGWGGHIVWPPRSPDFTPLDFCVWGYLKVHCMKCQLCRRRTSLLGFL